MGWSVKPQENNPFSIDANRLKPVAYQGILFGAGSTNSVEQRERGSGGGSPLVSGSAQFANELNLYSYLVVTDVFSTELEIRLSFVKTSEFFFLGGGGVEPPNPPPLSTPLVEASIENFSST
jgi:hypothetical protein